MLIITRKPGQRIMLGDDVTIEVISVSGSSVRLGIDAPRSVRVFREEIWSPGTDQEAEGAVPEEPAPTED